MMLAISGIDQQRVAADKTVGVQCQIEDAVATSVAEPRLPYIYGSALAFSIWGRLLCPTSITSTQTA